jgi:hypothetical protein
MALRFWVRIERASGFKEEDESRWEEMHGFSNKHGHRELVWLC